MYEPRISSTISLGSNLLFAIDLDRNVVQALLQFIELKLLPNGWPFVLSDCILHVSKPPGKQPDRKQNRYSPYDNLLFRIRLTLKFVENLFGFHWLLGR